MAPANYALFAAQGGSGWALTGNASIDPVANFLGTLDDQPLELRVNNTRALRIEPGYEVGFAPNLVGGSNVNQAGAGSSGRRSAAADNLVMPTSSPTCSEPSAAASKTRQVTTRVR
ncbi:MAG: hypothetical protein AMXMBFR13_32010 [Phycisphaerae bacterium]